MTDSEWVRAVTDVSMDHFYAEAYRLKAPLSPHASAELEGIVIDPETIILPDTNETLVVEGAGGVMVPLNDNFFMLDLIRKFSIPVLVVARSGLGTINHTLLTLNALRQYGIDITGVVMNGEINHSNRTAVERRGNVRVVAEIEPLEAINRQTLIEIYERFFDA
jgi:dethiobiotin synthase